MIRQRNPAFWRALAFCLIGLVGCTNREQRELQEIQAGRTMGTEKKDSVRKAFQFLPQLIRKDRTAALREIRYELNTWSATAERSKNWKSPEVLESLSPQLRSTDYANRLKGLEFEEAECEFLLQCQLLTQVARWVLDEPYEDGLFSGWLSDKKKELSPDDGLKLEVALKLFDWTICNVALNGAPKDVETLATNASMPLNDNASIYRQLPWQTMMFANGDRWERARLFTQFLFSQGIDCLVLALPSASGATEDAAIRLWCVGVPIGGEIYLFEPQWGLPIPSQAKSGGVATLRETRKDPSVLRRAKLPGLFDYPVEPADLENLIALLDIEPFAVGLGMATLQDSLTGENRMRVSSDVRTLEKSIAEIDPAVKIRLWNVPWIAHLYNASVRNRIGDPSPFSMGYMQNHGALITDTQISRARLLHFQGKFSTSVEEPGALRSYMDVRVDEQTLKDLDTDRELQKEFGLEKSSYETPEMFAMKLDNARFYLRQSKYDVGMYLAMANADLGKPETAVDWLTNRTLKLPEAVRWHAHAHYLLGRMQERLNKPELAIESYKFENSPQSAGNRIRMRLLSK